MRYHHVGPPRRREVAGKNDDVAELLEDLHDKVLALGDQVESMLIRSAGLLQRPDPEGMERLGDERRRVRHLRLAIEMRFMHQAIRLAHSVNQFGWVTEKVVSICSWIVFEIQGGTHVTSNV